jgi:hypothetical protein
MTGQHCVHPEELDEIAELQGTLTLTWVDNHPRHRQYAALLRLVEIARTAEARLHDVTAERDALREAVQFYHRAVARHTRHSPQCRWETIDGQAGCECGAGEAYATAAYVEGLGSSTLEAKMPAWATWLRQRTVTARPTEGREAPQGEREE